MDKKIGIGFLIIFICMAAFSFFIQSNKMNKADNIDSNSNINSNENKTEEIGNVNDIKFYSTDYKYDDNINGYNYNELSLTEDQVNRLKSEVSKIQLKNVADTIIYGKYKLVLDDKVIFFDMDNDYALYLNDNKVIYFKDSIKQILVSNTNNCSCCTTSDCKINLCSCN